MYLPTVCESKVVYKMKEKLAIHILYLYPLPLKYSIVYGLLSRYARNPEPGMYLSITILSKPLSRKVPTGRQVYKFYELMPAFN